MAYRHVKAGRRSWANRMSERDRAIVEMQAQAILRLRGDAIEKAHQQRRQTVRARQIPSAHGTCQLCLRNAPGQYVVRCGRTVRAYVSLERAVGVVARALRLGLGMDAFSVDVMLEWCQQLLRHEFEQINEKAEIAPASPVVQAYLRFSSGWQVPARQSLILRADDDLFIVRNGSYRSFTDLAQAVEYVHDSLCAGYGLSALDVETYLDWCVRLLEDEIHEIEEGICLA